MVPLYSVWEQSKRIRGDRNQMDAARGREEREELHRRRRASRSEGNVWNFVWGAGYMGASFYQDPLNGILTMRTAYYM